MNTSANQQPGQQTAKKPATKRGPGVGNFVFNPGLGGSVRPLLDSFQMFRNLLALLFLSSGMLDKTHPFFRPGVRFTLSDLFYETYARFNWKDKSKLPQNIFFLAVWGLIGVSILWVVVAIMSLLVGTAHASGESPTAAAASDCLFCAPENDLATKFIKNLIEGERIMGTGGSPSDAGYRPDGPPTGLIQGALRGMLSFYSSAILAFASFILLYHVINMVVQAAWSGKALEGAAQIWAPLRLVIAICLLVPLSNNLNAAQLMTLKIAEMGSGIATKAWHVFGEAMTGESAAAQATGAMASVNAAAENLFQIYACMYEVNASLDETAAALPADVATGVGNIFGGEVVSTYRLNPLIFDSTKYMIGDPVQKEMCGTYIVPRPMADATDASHNASSFGQRLANIKRPIRLKISEASDTLRQNIENIACQYVAAVRKAVGDDNADLATCTGSPASASAAAVPARGIPVDASKCPGRTESMAITLPSGDDLMASLGTNAREPATNAIACAIDAYYKTVTDAINGVFTAPAGGESAVDQLISVENTSWVEAGAYFVLISAVQNAISSVASEGPTANIGKLGRVKLMGDEAQLPALQATCHVEGEGWSLFNMLAVTEHQKDYVCRSREYKTVAGAAAQLQSGSPSAAAGTVFAGGLFEARKDAIIQFFSGPALRDPIGALFSFGHMLYIAATVLIMSALAAAAAAGAAGIFNMVPGVGALAGAAEGWVKVAIPLGFVTLGMAFPLAFLLPILPLVRFLSAVMSWLLAIFEAVVSMPLFALAHLNPGGNTLFAPAATGYQFLFHIAIKPILLVFGMIGAIIVLPIVLYALNIMFLPALDATWGEGDVMIWTKVFFFIAYATSAYGFVNISLKAIDDLSQKSIRWANFQGYQFRDDSETASGNAAAFAQYATTGLRGITSSVNSLASGGRKLAQKGEERRLGNMKFSEQAGGMKFLDKDNKEQSIIDQKTGKVSDAARAQGVFGEGNLGDRNARAFEKRYQDGARAIGAPRTGGFASSEATRNARSDIMAGRANVAADKFEKKNEREAAVAKQEERDAVQERIAGANEKVAAAVGPDGAGLAGRDDEARAAAARVAADVEELKKGKDEAPGSRGSVGGRGDGVSGDE